jgi:Kef-type K+ transport system membrane component KefB
VIEYIDRIITKIQTALHLPLNNPVLILSVVLLIILFAPLVFKRFKIPGIFGLIISGVLISPNALQIIEKSKDIELFSTIGLLYIMFLAGLEIDLQEYRKNQKISFLFGTLTFFIPLGLGLVVCLYYFKMSMISSLLLSSMFSTHTLLSYPIVSSMGITKNRAVQIAIGGTIITDTAVLILLGIITSSVQGELNQQFWIKLLISLTLLLSIIMFLLPRISRWFFRNIEGQNSTQYIYVLALVFISAFLAQLAGVEPIIGAFLAGLALNRVIPHNSSLMNRIIFIGNTLFIPFFLISVGMLVDLRVLFHGYDALLYAAILSGVALLTKYLAALFTRYFYNYNRYEGQIIFGLSSSHAAATMAVILVGYRLNLLDINAVNGTIILILVTSMVSSFVTEKAARKIALIEKSATIADDTKERLLLPISNPDNIQRLVDFSLILKDPKSDEPIFPLSIVTEDSNNDAEIDQENKSFQTGVTKQVIERVVEQYSGNDQKVEVLLKVDLNIVDGILRTSRAYNITDIIVNYKSNVATTDFIFGAITDSLISKTTQLLILSKIIQPLNSFNKVITILPPNSEIENGFIYAIKKINRIMRQIGRAKIVYGTENTIKAFQRAVQDKNKQYYEYKVLTTFEQNAYLNNQVGDDTLLLILNARKRTVSYDINIDNLPKYLNKNLDYTSYVVFYPRQELTMSSTQGIMQMDDFVGTPIEENLSRLKDFRTRIRKVFRFKKTS